VAQAAVKTCSLAQLTADTTDMKLVLASCLALVHCQDIFLAATQPNVSNSMEAMAGSTRCVQQCQKSGYSCKGCSNIFNHPSPVITNCASTYNHPSCAMGCHMGQFSKTVSECESSCDKGDNKCNWVFRATVMSNCQGNDNCPNQNRIGSSKEECKSGCRQAFQDSHNNGPQMTPSEAIAAVNKIRSHYGKAPMTWHADKKACADKAAAYNSAHGPHKCGIDGVCHCGFQAAGDFDANDIVDAINRAYATRYREGPKDGTCDERSHCGALLKYSGIVVGFYEKTAYAVIQYF